MIASKNLAYFLRIFFDFLILNISFALAATFAQSFTLFYKNNLLFVLEFFLNISWFFSANIIGFYEDVSSGNFANDVINIFKNSIIQVFIAVFFLFVIKESLFTRNFILYYFVLLVVLISIKKLFFIYVLKYLQKKEFNTRNILIIGAGEIGQNFYNSLNNHTSSDYKVLGFLDDRKSDALPLLGTIDQFNEVVSSNKIDDVVIALPYSQIGRIERLIKICNRNALRTHIIPDYFQFVSRKFRISMIDNLPIITVRNEPLSEFHWRLAKRFFDIIISFCFTVLILSWVIPLIALIQKLTSPGPVFFIQNRVGQRNKTFRCLKFRTMSVEASSRTNEIKATTDDDPRVTKFGKFLRKTNIDEFPQFLNVFIGDMSVVGPRPAAISYNELYNEYIEELKLRHLVKPGITGWAQIHGLRGDCPDEEENKLRIIKRFEYDLWYIENWSIILDLQIILLTVWQIVKGKNLGR